MGVTGLWRLLQPCGQPVHTESLQNKTVAVDVSIWLNQAMKGYRDSNGQPLPNAHLLCVFHRVCKLLAYRVRPVFVFDGGVPSLKYHTLNERRLRKQTASGAAQRTSTALVHNLIRQHALRTVLGEEEPIRTRSVGASQSEDMFQLPASSCVKNKDDDDHSDSDSSSACSSDSEADAIVNRLGTNLHDFDFDAAEFQSLPSQTKHDILSELKDTRKQSSWGKMHEMPDDSGSFSSYQMDRLLKRKKFQDTMNKVEADITKRNTELLHLGIGLGETLSVRRMASKADTYLVLGKLSSPNKKCQSRTETSHESDFKFVKDLVHADNSDGTNEPDLKSIERKHGDMSAPGNLDIRKRDTKIVDLAEYEKDMDISSMKSDEFHEKKSSYSIYVARGVPLKSSACVTEASSEIEDIGNSKVAEKLLEKLGPDAEPTGGPVSVHDSKKILNFESEKLLKERPSVKSSGLVLSIDPNHSSKDDLFDDVFVGNRENKNYCNPLCSSDIKNVIQIEKECDNVSDMEGIMTDSDSETEDRLDKQKIISVDNATDTVLQSTSLNDRESLSSNLSDNPLICEGVEIEISKQMNELSPDSFEETSHDHTNNERRESFSLEKEIPVVENNTLEAIENKTSVESNSVPVIDNIDGPIDGTPMSKEAEIVDMEQHTELNNFSADVESDASLEDELLLKEGLTEDQMRDLASDLSGEQSELLKERGRQNRLAASVSDQMYADIQNMLQLFGIPYVVAPMEAEAQCAFLESVGLTDGTITDDSDVWLFGGRLVYKNFFNQNRHVEKYRVEDIERLLGVGREHLICVALLTGSDYTTGVDGVGCVRALEILAEFPGRGLDSLRLFKQWWKSVNEEQSPVGLSSLRRNLAELQLGNAFPSDSIAKAYLEPEVDTNREPFSWAEPDFDGLRQMAASKMGWSMTQTDSILQPVIKRMASSSVQTNLLQFFNTEVKEVSPRKQSQRLKRVTDKIRFGEDITTASGDVSEKKIHKSKNLRANYWNNVKGEELVDDPSNWMDDELDEELANMKEDGLDLNKNVQCELENRSMSHNNSTKAIGSATYKLSTPIQSNTDNNRPFHEVENAENEDLSSNSVIEASIDPLSSSSELPNHLSEEQLRRVNITRDLRLRAQRIKTSLQTSAELGSPQPVHRRTTTRGVRNQMYQQLLKSNPRLRAERVINMVNKSTASTCRRSSGGVSTESIHLLGITKQSRGKCSRTKKSATATSSSASPGHPQLEANTSERIVCSSATSQNAEIEPIKQETGAPIQFHSDIIPQLEADKRNQAEAKRKALQIFCSRRPGQRKKAKVILTMTNRAAANLSEEDSDL